MRAAGIRGAGDRKAPGPSKQPAEDGQGGAVGTRLPDPPCAAKVTLPPRPQPSQGPEPPEAPKASRGATLGDGQILLLLKGFSTPEIHRKLHSKTQQESVAGRTGCYSGRGQRKVPVGLKGCGGPGQGPGSGTVLVAAQPASRTREAGRTEPPPVPSRATRTIIFL